jgi:uncharacterized protein
MENGRLVSAGAEFDKDIALPIAAHFVQVRLRDEIVHRSSSSGERFHTAVSQKSLDCRIHGFRFAGEIPGIQKLLEEVFRNVQSRLHGRRVVQGRICFKKRQALSIQRAMDRVAENTPAGRRANLPAGRSASVDVLRGFALLGIIWVNAPFFAYNPAEELPVESASDYAALWLTLTVASGKFFILFSFLFGFGISVMLSRGSAPLAGDVRGRFFRRAVGLWVIGLAHAVFLFFGDILVLYGTLSLCVWFFRGRSDRFLLGCACIAFGVGVLTQTVLMLPQLWAFLEEDAAEHLIGQGFGGSYGETVRERLMLLPVSAGIVLLFNGGVACACFFLGLLAGRKGWFPVGGERLRALRRPAAFAAAGGLLASGTASWVYLTNDQGPWLLSLLAGLALSLSAPFISFAWAVAVLSWAERAVGGRLASALATVGRRSLTGYLLHSFLLGFIYHGWGLGWFERMGQASVMATAFGVFGVIGVVLHVWSRWFRYGPDEWLLRSFIDLQAKPLRK